jgi:carbon dioxide concentrating mechanism protein CcmO
VKDAIGFLETTGLTPAMVALDTMVKSAPVRVLQVEVNDLKGVCVKFAGPVDAVQMAVMAGQAIAARMGGKPIAHRVASLDPEAEKAVISPPEYNPLIQQEVVFQSDSAQLTSQKESHMNDEANFALGLIETQGFTAVFEAVDTACKAANVQVVGKEKLGGGFVTVIIKGDLSAVTAAVDAGRNKVNGLGTLIAAHVIARPSQAVLGLLPKL